MVTETEMCEIITEALYEEAGSNGDAVDISTFEKEILIIGKGFLVKLWDGSEFHVAIHSKR